MTLTTRVVSTKSFELKRMVARETARPSRGVGIRNRIAMSFTVETELSETNYRRALEVRGKSDTVLIGAE